MKPLFDSEQFSFIGSQEDRIYVHCRKCGSPANVQIELSQSRGAELSAICTKCRNQRRFTIVNAVQPVSASS